MTARTAMYVGVETSAGTVAIPSSLAGALTPRHVLPAGPGSTDAPSEEDERQAEYFDAALARGCVVLYLHGNAFARNHGHRRDLYRLVSAGLGCHLVTLDYRGYGDSDGTPSEASQLEDAALAWAWLAERAATQRVVLWGHSLGGAVANLLCARLLGGGEPPRGLVLQATLVSMREAVLDNPLARPFAWLPGLREALDRLWADKYAAREALEVTAAHGLPVLVLHGTADAVVSFRHGLELRGVVERAQPGATGDASGLVVIEAREELPIPHETLLIPDIKHLVSKHLVSISLQPRWRGGKLYHNIVSGG